MQPRPVYVHYPKTAGGPSPFLDRYAMLTTLERHGWTCRTDFDGQGPVMIVEDPSSQGRVIVKMPALPESNHWLNLQDVYYIMGQHKMNAAQGGTA